MLDNFTINKIDFVFTQLYALKFSCDLIQQVKIFLIWTRTRNWTRLKINFRPGTGPGPGEEKFLDPDPDPDPSGPGPGRTRRALE